MIVPSGVGQGGRLKLREWQKQFIRDVYEPHIGDRRQVRRAILSIARKNGKTLLIAALALAHLIGPEAILNGEIYSAANDRDQAAQVFKVAAQMVRADPELLDKLKLIDSTKTIACYRNGSFYRAISAEAGTKHGLNPTFVIYDELAQSKNRDLYDVLDTSMGARLEPLFVTISTQSNDPEHILSKLIDDGLNAADPTTVCHLYQVPEECLDIFDPKVWKLANPALGDFRDRDDFTSLARKAKRMPSEEPKFRNLYLNQRVAPYASLLPRSLWFACHGEVRFAEGEPVYLGLDLSARNDLTALVMASADEPTRIKPFFWKPGELLNDHSDRDFGHSSRRYQLWRDEGWLKTTPGRSIDLTVVATAIAELSQRYKIRGLAFDRWRIDALLVEFDRIGFQAFQDKSDNVRGYGLRMVGWGQGYQDMGPAIDALCAAVDAGRLVHDMNPVLNWNIGNSVATMNAAGERKIDKAKVKFRVDGAVALVMALGLKTRDRVKPPLDIAAMINFA